MRTVPIEGQPIPAVRLSQIEPKVADWLYLCCPKIPISSGRGRYPDLDSHVPHCESCLTEWARALTLEAFAG